MHAMPRNTNPCNSFVMVNMASGMYCRRMHPVTTRMFCMMAAILWLIPSLGLQHTSLILDMLWSVDTGQCKVFTDQYHMTILQAQPYSYSKIMVSFSS